MHAAIYVRKSTAQTGMNEDARSVERQKLVREAYARQHGWTVPTNMILRMMELAERSLTVDQGFSASWNR